MTCRQAPAIAWQALLLQSTSSPHPFTPGRKEVKITSSSPSGEGFRVRTERRRGI